MILRVLLSPVALLLGLLPARWFTPREFEDAGDTWIAEGTARVTWL
jgi:hypothetical protein